MEAYKILGIGYVNEPLPVDAFPEGVITPSSNVVDDSIVKVQFCVDLMEPLVDLIYLILENLLMVGVGWAHRMGWCPFSTSILHIGHLLSICP